MAKGQKRRDQKAYGRDSIAYSSENDSLRPFSNGVYEVQTYHTQEPKYVESSGYRQNMASVRHSVRDAQELPYAAWPGPNVALDSDGNESESSGVSPIMYHGLFEGPMPGQKVAVAFAHGDNNDPIVIEKYSTQSSGLTNSDVTFTTPFQRFNMSYKDVGLGHYTGSYINLRAELPLPGAIEIYSSGKIFVETDFGYEILAGVEYTMDIAETWTVTINENEYSIASDSAPINIGNTDDLEPVIKGDKSQAHFDDLANILTTCPLTIDLITGPEMASPELISNILQWKERFVQTKSNQVNTA